MSTLLPTIVGHELTLKVVVSVIATPIVALIAWAGRRTRHFVRDRWTVSIGHSLYETVAAREAELPDLVAFYKKHFGDDVPTVTSMREWLKRYRRAFWLVYENDSRKSSRRPLVGSFKVLPITRSGAAALDAELVAGSTFQERHIAARPRDTVAYYVGDVVGQDRGSRAAIVSKLEQLIQNDFASYPIYARPLKGDGQRIMRKAGFRCVSDGSEPQLRRICLLAPRVAKPSRPRRVRPNER